jgi:hypothetical protein
MPFKLITINFIYSISSRCTILADWASPPCATNSPICMFINTIFFSIGLVVGMASHVMYIFEFSNCNSRQSFIYYFYFLLFFPPNLSIDIISPRVINGFKVVCIITSNNCVWISKFYCLTFNPKKAIFTI